MPETEMWYACPIESQKPENQKELEAMAEWYAKEKGGNDTMDKPCCGNCKYHYHESVDDGWVCTNPDSDSLADWTEYNDYCYDWERREECNT